MAEKNTYKFCAPDGLAPEAEELFKKSEVFEWLDPSTDWLNAEVLVVRSATSVTTELVDKMPDLKFVLRAGVGTDNIDFEACNKKSIKIWRAPEGNFQSTAELALGMVFSLFRNLNTATTTTQKGEWKKKELSKSGKQVAGAKLGVLGAGNIGLRLAKMAKSLGMGVSIHDPFYKGSEYPNLSLEELFEFCDVVSMHLPLTDQTRSIVNIDLINKSKNGVFIINTSRGGLVSEEDLALGLESGKLLGLGLDVYTNEPVDVADSAISKLFAHPRVVLTPHMGASTKEAQRAVGLEAFDKLSRIVEDQDLGRDFRDSPLN